MKTAMIAAILAAVLAGGLGALTVLTARTPTPSPLQTDQEFHRDLLQIHLMGALADCIRPELSAAQKNYLMSGIGQYRIQRYLLAEGIRAHATACQERAIAVCERLDPGDCIAMPSKIEGRHP